MQPRVTLFINLNFRSTSSIQLGSACFEAATKKMNAQEPSVPTTENINYTMKQPGI
jgi:hypothetical protein